ncbi:Endocytosis protein end4 [Labeo rohita]|uniref:Endocytosis protein end4 n=1 Tax=Labeo rohita TaxID=84645 RepID=A0ABQ8L8H3_LABRO|nr:Endocytosis protein end4 [Labeo rohita]
MIGKYWAERREWDWQKNSRWESNLGRRSLVPPASPWSDINHPSPLDSTPPTWLHPSGPPALSGSSVAPAPPRPSGSTAPSRSPEPSVLPQPSRSSSSPWLLSRLLCLRQASALPPPWCFPPLAPPWVAIMAVAWVPPSSSCFKSLLDR